MLKMVIFVINTLLMIFLLLLISGVVSVLLILAGLIVLLVPSKKKKNTALTLSQALGIKTTAAVNKDVKSKIETDMVPQPYQIVPQSRIVNPESVDIPIREIPKPHQPYEALTRPCAVNSEAVASAHHKSISVPYTKEQIQQLITNHEILLTLIEGVQKIGNSRKDEQVIKTAKTLVQTVEGFAGEQSWLAIKPYIETLYPDFFKKLNSVSSEALSDFEIRTCLLSVFDMSSKEIAHITNRSVRTVETSVYKIRKKMSIPTDMRLPDFLHNL